VYKLCKSARSISYGVGIFVTAEYLLISYDILQCAQNMPCNRRRVNVVYSLRAHIFQLLHVCILVLIVCMRRCAFFDIGIPV